MSYALLEERFREIAHLEHALALLEWDEAVMMPSGGGEARGQALATLTATMHQKLADVALADLFDRSAAEHNGLTADQQLNLNEMRKRWQDATVLPTSLVRARKLAVARCEQLWREKRAQNDWLSVVPALAEVIKLVRETAQHYAALDGSSPYDALLTRHQPGISEADVRVIFGNLKAQLPPMVEAALAKQTRPLDLPSGFAVAQQKLLGERLMSVLGFDFSKGRLDVSHHPFSGGVPDDTRITTRYADDSFLPAQMAVLHETGHGLYQQGQPQAWRDQPLGDHAGVAVHESQSLFFEMQVARSQPFMNFAAPIMQETLTGAIAADPVWSAKNLYQQATQVRRGFIRVDADELTYPLHVILRFELEQQLLAGSLALADLPDAWNAAMQSSLGLSTQGNDRNGCMQDVHWFAGIFGYFPCYTLGAIAAAQFAASMRHDLPEFDDHIGRGFIAPLLNWLRTKVHQRGRRAPMQSLLRDATGETLNPAHFLAHLRQRYLN